MLEKFKNPPAQKIDLSSTTDLATKLTPLIGSQFKLTGKTRTDGSSLRKLISRALDGSSLPTAADNSNYTIIPPKKKGVPKILLEYVDTYIATSGDNYNLQVWNRNPASKSVQIVYKNGDELYSDEVRFILVKVDPVAHLIKAIAVTTPDYIVKRFGKFGKPTVKSQLIISDIKRNEVLNEKDSILFYDDDVTVGKNSNLTNLATLDMHDEPTSDSLLPLSTIKDKVKSIIGKTIPADSTRNRGQHLERMVAAELGYANPNSGILAGGYPDIRNQALEVKVQDSPTIDLGKYTPEFIENVPQCANFNTGNIRYLIALTDPTSSLIKALVLCPGNKLGIHFTHVANQSYKCQRSIPMSFFEGIDGKSISLT